MFFKPKNDTAASVGIENKKDIVAESTLLNFKNLAAVIVIPDLLVPGISDNICISPINIADLMVKLDLISLLILNLSLKKSKTPNIIVVQPMTSIFLSF